MGYPSALAYLAQIGLMTVGLEWRPRAIFYSSEPLLPHQGSVLRDYFDCPIRGLYGMAERVLSAAECPEGNFHLGLCDGYLEGQFDGSGNENNAVVTGLANPAMPLLRYQLDDSLQVRPGIACRCGRTLPVIEAVMNRRGDMVSTIAGMQIPAPALTLLLKDIEGLRRTQIVQRSREHVHVRFESTPQARAQVIRTIAARFKAVLGPEMIVTVDDQDEMHRTRTGKIPFVLGLGAGSSQQTTDLSRERSSKAQDVDLEAGARD
jgi:phenylacetate-CoA ligase